METGSGQKWRFKANEEVMSASKISVRGVLMEVMSNLNGSDSRPIILLGHGDPSAFPCFRTTSAAEDAVIGALLSAEFNGYVPTVGVLPARRLVNLGKQKNWQKEMRLSWSSSSSVREKMNHAFIVEESAQIQVSTGERDFK